MSCSGKRSCERQVLAAAQALVQRFTRSPGAFATLPDTVLPDTPPARLPAVDAARAIPRCPSAELPRARFRQEFWKADAPVIITGAASLQNSLCLRSCIRRHHHPHLHCRNIGLKTCQCPDWAREATAWSTPCQLLPRMHERPGVRAAALGAQARWRADRHVGSGAAWQRASG